mgnify:CR=1 FL=1
MNATGLGIANYLAKTNEEKRLHYKIIPTVIALGMTTFATPHLAIALKNRFVVVLTSDAALKICGLNLAVKALTYMLYILGSRTTPLQTITTPEEINDLSPEQIKLYYVFYNSKENQQLFSNQAEDIKDAFLKAFFILPEVQQVINSRDPEVIKGYTKLQASLLHAHLSSTGIIPPPAEHIFESYSQLFFKHDLKLLPNGSPNNKNQIAKNLPIPSDPSYFAGLSRNQMEWYILFTSDFAVWKSHTLEAQHAFNQKCSEYGISPWNLYPSDVQSIQNANDTIILCLDTQFRMNVDYIPQEQLEATEDRVFAIRDSLHVKITTQEVEKLTEDEIQQCRYLYSIYDKIELQLPSKEIQIALSKKFITHKLYPPMNEWQCDCEVSIIDPVALAKLTPAQLVNLPPVDANAIAQLEHLQLSWICQFLCHDDATWTRIGFQSQVAFNNRFSEIFKEALISLTAPPLLRDINTINDRFALKLYERYQLLEFYLGEWDHFSFEVQMAFNVLFKKIGKLEIPRYL